MKDREPSKGNGWRDSDDAPELGEKWFEGAHQYFGDLLKFLIFFESYNLILGDFDLGRLQGRVCDLVSERGICKCLHWVLARSDHVDFGLEFLDVL